VDGGEPVCGGDAECDDKNPCTTDLCMDGECVHEMAEGGACDDWNKCTEGDQCTAEGLCAGTPLSCDDVDQCTKDSCAPESGCEHKSLPEWTPCDDGDGCTKDDTCADGECSGMPVVCDDENVCTSESCDPETGACVTKDLDSTQCNDEDECTAGDACAGGQCLPAGPLSCDDGNICTDDWCDPLTGCKHTDNDAPCNDGSLCTGNDLCVAGVCVGQEALQCSDSNICTADSCVPDVGCQNTPVAGPCNDGDPCTLDDHCDGGVCVNAGASDCDDGAACTADACNPETGECMNTPLDSPCDDGSLCTTGDTCVEGACVGTGVSCDDGEVCTSDSCDAAGGCVNVPVGGQCDDGNVCTVGDACVDGVCTAGADALACDDGNVCTDDICNPQWGTGCDHIPNAAPCDDGNGCTAGDNCAGAMCQPGGTNVCFCESDTDCVLQDDGDLCNGKLVCDKSGVPHVCVIDPSTVVVCAADQDTECLQNLCDPTTGQCAFVPVHEGNACDDWDLCTSDDKCAAGSCKGFPVICVDGNVCTDDGCDPAAGCTFTPNALACDDGNSCSLLDTCKDGACAPQFFQSCDDANSCTDDACLDEKNGCVNLPNAALCNDGNLCTVVDTCAAGVCSGVPVSCDDDNVCTDELCTPEQGCVFTANTLGCDDGNPCTLLDQCAAGVCLSKEVLTCNDGNACTDDACIPEKGGCVYQPNASPCDDGNLCTSDDHCGAGVCGGAPLNCNDENVCTDDECDPGAGCFYLNNVAPCTDDDACTKGDHCEWGGCEHTLVVGCDDKNVCTFDSCNSKNGACLHEPAEGACDDATVCTTGDHCAAGKCVGDAISCDDLNECTADSCDPVESCQHEDLSTLCDDTDACTEGDKCDGGECVGSDVDCDDGNDCTDDSCDTVTGCAHEKNTAECDDGDPLTALDTCSGGVCAGLPDEDEDGVPSEGFDHTCEDLEILACNDNCPADANPDQADWNGNGDGDVCDPCKDAELCNGIDDDCDNQVDEGFTGIGETCDSNDADPCAKGKRECSADGKSVVCKETGSVQLKVHAPTADELVWGAPVQVRYPLTAATSVKGSTLASIFGASFTGTKFAAFEIPKDMYAFSQGLFVHREEPDLKFYAAFDIDLGVVDVFAQGQYGNLVRFFGPCQAYDTYGTDPEYLGNLPHFLVSHLLPWMTIESYLTGAAATDVADAAYSAYVPNATTRYLFRLAHETKECCAQSSDMHNAGQQAFNVTASNLLTGFHYGWAANGNTLNDSWIYRDNVEEAHARDCCAGDVMSRRETANAFLMLLKLARSFGSSNATWYYAGIAGDMAADKAIDILTQEQLGRRAFYLLEGLTPSSLENASGTASTTETDVVVDSGSCDVKKTYTAPVGEAFHKIYLKIWTSPVNGGASNWYYVEGKETGTTRWQRIMESGTPDKVVLDSYDLFGKTGRVYDQIRIYVVSDCTPGHVNLGHYELKLWSAKYTAGAAVQVIVAGRPLPAFPASSSGTALFGVPSDGEIEVKVDDASICSGFAYDADDDGIASDGNESGLAGDAPCSGGTTNCDDNCPDAPNADQKDTDGDGIGDVCE